VKIATLFCVMY